MPKEKPLDLEETLDDFYHREMSFYVKDKQGLYLGCNQFLLDFCNVSRQDDFVGISDYMTPWEDIANHLIDNDQQVMQSGQSVKFFEVLKDCQGNYRIFLSHKKPLMRDGKVAGIAGVSVEAPPPTVDIKSVLTPNTCFIDIAKKKMLELTYRQKEVLHLLLQGITAKDIATRLSISKRTVEHHIELIKELNEYLNLKDILLYVRVV